MTYPFFQLCAFGADAFARSGALENDEISSCFVWGNRNERADVFDLRRGIVLIFRP